MVAKRTNNKEYNMTTIQKISLVDQATKVIQNSLSNGELILGSKILLSEMSKKLGISITPLREAIRKIEAEGIIKSNHGKGFIVRIPLISEIQEIFAVRKKLETMACKLACDYITNEEIQKIKKIQDNIKNTKYNQFNSNDLKLFIQLNKNFHYCIYNASRNKILVEAIATLWRKSSPLIASIIYTKKKLAKLEKEHDDILEALKQKNKTKIQKATNRHLNTTERIATQYAKTLGSSSK